MEFRGFVCKKKLNALAQYFHYCFFPELVQRKKEIETKIVDYFNSQIVDKVPHNSYVIDFCMLHNGELKIIEVNPFHFSTGAPFFGWKKGSEGRHILLYGPFTFRMREELPPPDIKDHYLVPAWEKFINQVLNRPEQKTTTTNTETESGCSTM